MFRDAGIIQNLHGGGGTEVFPILEHPDDLFVRGDLVELWTLAVSAADQRRSFATPALRRSSLSRSTVPEPLDVRQ